jgi:hypothetical protein
LFLDGYSFTNSSLMRNNLVEKVLMFTQFFGY